MPDVRRKRVAILISGRGSNMASLIEAAHAPGCSYEVALVISNEPSALGLDRASASGVATLVIDHRRFGKDREAFERAVNDELAARDVELVCLAGFMRLLTPWFVGRWRGRLVNIHPSLLPAFKGLRTHERVLEAGVKISGATAHFVSDAMDEGPIVAQAAVPVIETDSAESLAQRVLAAEHRLYPLAVELVASERVQIVDGRCRVQTAGDPHTVLLSACSEQEPGGSS